MLLIEVGGFDGSDSLHFYEQGYTVITFEPERALYAALAAKTAHLQNYRVVNKAVSLTNGTTDFYVCKSGGASSILPFKSDEELNAHWTAQRTDIHYSGVSYPVETTRLDTFLEANGLTTTPIDYLHVDAQGADLDVLRSLGVYISNVRRGVVETCYSLDKAIYASQRDDLTAVKHWIASHGFEIERIESNDREGCECNVYFKARTPSLLDGSAA
jgi:FkbM family methyltransferase